MSGKYQVGEIIKFKHLISNYSTAFLYTWTYKARQNTWNDIVLEEQNGIILETLLVENIIKPEYQKYYQGKGRIPYLWYCFRTAKVYLVFEYEFE